MTEPLRDDDDDNNDKHDDTEPRSTARRAIAVGAIVFLACAALMLLPLVIPLGSIAKFVVAPAFVGACAGLSIAANALIDRRRPRR
jgi:hypothetical protein